MSIPDDDIGQLLRTAGRGPEPSRDATARIYQDVREQWQTQVSRRRRNRFAAMAACLVLATVGTASLGWFSTQHMPTQVAARITRGVEGIVIKRHALALRTEFDPELVAVGDTLSTGSRTGALLAQLPQGTTTLRLDRHTTLQWQAANRLRLLTGSVYVDTGKHGTASLASTPPAEPLRIEAAGALIEHVGTQFLATVEPDRVVVGVRDGLVTVSMGLDSATFRRGEMATITTARRNSAANPIQRGRVAPAGELWHWADELAPHLAIEGQNLESALQTLAYQAGLHVSFASDAAEASARAIILHGPALDMPPAAALRALLATTSFRTLPTEPQKADQMVIEAR
ncbi:MAG: FecR family protein [Pseudomonadota bacterium]